MDTKPLLVSIQVGMPSVITDTGFSGKQSTWHTGIFKLPVSGPVWLDRINLAGDGQADWTVHGGPDKAVMAYSADHYPFWREQFPNLEYGAFGENFTVTGLSEENVYINDIYEVGEARIQVSQPRQPCWKLARKLHSKTLPAIVIQTGFSGWYFRVLQEGHVEAGQSFTLLERPLPDWPITRVYREVLYPTP